MRLEFELGLRDAPGALAPVLQAIADHGANVLAVVHRHEATTNEHVPVLFTVEVPEGQSLRLVDAMSRHRLLRVGHEGGPVRATLILTGHVFQARLDQLLGAVWDDARIERVDARLAGKDAPSAALVRISATDAPALQRATSALLQRADAAGLQAILSLEESDA